MHDKCWPRLQSGVEKGSMAKVVILVDNRVRDLDVAALIAHHLRGMDIECRLEPLESFRAVLAADRPDLILFNHLTASHLVAWSKRLADIGVLTAVLPNEGILYDPDVLAYNAGRHHNGAHIDCFFCWNDAHRLALAANGFAERARVETVGVPRFDFYFEPWSRIFARSGAPRVRPQLLFCTNFTTAKYHDLPRKEADRVFAAWAPRISLYRDYWPAIDAHWRSRNRVLDYVAVLASSGRYDVVLRPHPNEDRSFYARWLDRRPAEQRKAIRFDTDSNIASLILDCDLEISCETCTTAVESWIAGKPTIELVFERHPMWYRELQAPANVECDHPDKLVELVETQLYAPDQREKQELRRLHLEEWCAVPRGNSSERIARIIADAIRTKKPADWSKLTLNDYRRAAKLRALRKIGLPYHFDPFLRVKRSLFGDSYAMKTAVYAKSIRLHDVIEAHKSIQSALDRHSNGGRPAA
jgi:surface carbohydrate biosynthesis protein